MTIKIGNYKGLGYDRPDINVTNEEVNEFVDYTRSTRQIEVNKNVGIEKNDNIAMGFSCYHKGNKIEELSVKSYRLKIGNGFFYKDFEAALYGKKQDDKLTIDMKLPEDINISSLAGEEVKFVVNISSVKEHILPELTDTFVKSLKLAEVNTVDELILHGKNKISLDKMLQKSASLVNKIMNDILNHSVVELNETEVTPLSETIFVDFEKKLKQQDANIGMYLLYNKMTENELLENCKKEATLYLTEKAVLEEIASLEDIQVNINNEMSQEEMDQHLYQEVVKFLLKTNTK